MSTPGVGVTPVPRRPRGRAGRGLVVLAIVLAVLLAGVGYYQYSTNRAPSGVTTLVVYTYSSLFGGSCGGPVFDSVFGPFERAHDVSLRIECPSGTLYNALVDQNGTGAADLVIGLDEITAPQAEAAETLVPYASPELAHVPAALVSGLSPDHAVTPYEYGFLAVDFTPGFNASVGGVAPDLSFETLAQNSSWSSNLLIENPTTDIVGEEFLLWEIAYYQRVLGQSWQPFWQSAAPHVRTAIDWQTAFGEFSAPSGGPGMVVSFSTDPAYAAFSGTPGAFNATVVHHNGTAYSWRTTYGIGIVNHSRHLGLDQQFIDWFLEGTVQDQIPTNEWEYPANSTVPLPAVFSAAIAPESMVPLNDFATPAQLHANLSTWLDEWQLLENQFG